MPWLFVIPTKRPPLGALPGPWLFVHGILPHLRAALHAQLRDTATSQDGNGPPAKVTYSCRVASFDAENETVSFDDGSTKRGDLIIGADGVTSVTRKQIDPNIQVKYGRHSAFRFLVSEKEALADLRTSTWFSTRSTMDIWYSADSKVVMYRCQDNELLNFVCIHPASKSSTIAGDWHKLAEKGVLLELFSEFEPRVLAMLEKADPKSLRVYPLLDMNTLPSFISATGRLASLGDAAHPFLPHLAQGGAMAIEDGVSLGVVMSQLDSVEEVPERLKLYKQARYERATVIQEYTCRVGGDSVKQNEHSAAKLSLNDYMQYPYSHDEHLASEDILRNHLRSKQSGV
ncbi:hypothetical protein B0A48_18683 [Cryoendolithus antarcticus]|uniref:FAD-binding domain-containing protein n=1 Tax=Cryoendolithus antarcticus TaxID=1507870 RepID=A0A1V8S7X6_9PEZI|nr:hypothetical protein B0A48_18683 [Cryoendolithus antarcticus]